MRKRWPVFIGMIAGIAGGTLLSGMVYAQDPLISPSSPDVFSVNQEVLAEMVRQALSLPPGARLVLKNPPKSFRDYGDPPTGGHVTVESSDPERSLIHMAVEVTNGESVSEVLYFDVSTFKSRRSSAEITYGPGEVVQTLVRSGDEVRIVAKGNGFEVSLPGIAQNDGGMGDLVTVVNARSGARLRGSVFGPDRIVVGMEESREKTDNARLPESGEGTDRP